MATDPVPHCARCGAPLPPDAPDQLCPACLLAAGLGGLSGLSGVTDQTGSSGRQAPARFLPGTHLGHYQIVRLIGRGGMGEVYEAVSLADGRRLALKVLSTRLDRPSDRERFRREGQLAATVSHPHVVYVFGNEEIDGLPVIVMELLPAGTLSQRVKATGPMSPVDAVEAALQVVAGLDAARTAGVLHRDVKPSNCFIDANGVVKVGDFGLAVLFDRDGAHAAGGAFHGTPGFAAPEQRRGEAIDVRADIYGVGATLYFLLTGLTPVDAAARQKKPSPAPPAPTFLDRKVPMGLSAIVLGMLEPDPADRPATYGEVSRDLSGFGVSAPLAGSLGRRLVAWLIDLVLMAGMTLAIDELVTYGAASDWPTLERTTRDVVIASATFLPIVYFGVAEGLWGRSVGKYFCNLRVVNARGVPPGIASATARNVVLNLFGYLIALGVLVEGSETAAIWFSRHPTLTSVAIVLWQTAILSPIWQSSGRKMLQDFMTGSAVVEPAPESVARRPALESPLLELAAVDASRIGPYRVTGCVARVADGEVLAAIDDRLNRAVWIHTRGPGAAPVTQARCDVSRAGRLRWLAAGRDAIRTWDAYEAPGGAGFLRLTETPQAWSIAKFWLADLARELDAAADERAMPPLTLDRIWITRANTAVIVEFLGASPAVSLSRDAALRAPAVFLSSVSARAVGGGTDASVSSSGRIPIEARSRIDQLNDPSVTGARAVAVIVEPLALERDRIPRWRRALPIVAVTLPVVAASVVVLTEVPLMRAQQRAGLDRLAACLDLLSDNGRSERTGIFLTQYRQVEIYVSGQFGDTLRGPTASGLSGRQRLVADTVLRDYPSVAPDLFAWARRRVEPPIDAYIVPDREHIAEIDRVGLPAALGVIVTAMLGCFAAAGVILSIARPGGVLLGWIDVSVMDAHGQPISHARSVARALVTWSPLWLAAAFPPAASHAPSLASTLVMWTPAALMACGAAAALATPERGPADRVCGTFLG